MTTVSRPSGRSTSTPLRLCCRAPRMRRVGTFTGREPGGATGGPGRSTRRGWRDRGGQPTEIGAQDARAPRRFAIPGKGVAPPATWAILRSSDGPRPPGGSRSVTWQRGADQGFLCLASCAAPAELEPGLRFFVRRLFPPTQATGLAAATRAARNHSSRPWTQRQGRRGRLGVPVAQVRATRVRVTDMRRLFPPTQATGLAAATRAARNHSSRPCPQRQGRRGRLGVPVAQVRATRVRVTVMRRLIPPTQATGLAAATRARE